MTRRYTKEDFSQVKEWGEKWGSTYDSDLFPETGFIWPGVAAYFLYKTDSKVCYLENMVRNPDMPKELTDLALQSIITHILKEARDLGFKVAYATTASDAVIDRALKHNAEATRGQTLLALKFK